MRLFSTRIVVALFGALFLFGCAAQQPIKAIPAFSPTIFDSNEYDSAVDNFLIILDASSSMDDSYMGNKKFVVATQIVDRLNQTLPELGQNAGLRSFGHSKLVSDELTVLFYGMAQYSTKELDEKLKLISTSGGTSPMYGAITAAGQDLMGASGKTAVIIISDGQERYGIESTKTMATVQALKDQLGDGVCFYPIFVGDNADGMDLMNDIAKVGKCGFTSKSDTLLTSSGMGKFVEDVFLTRKAVAPVVVAPEVTVVVPPPVVIEGLNSKGAWVVGEAFFDFDKVVIKPGAFDYLDKIVEILKTNPEITVRIQGHTDSVGSKVYNDALSMKRAESVKTYLTNNGIDGSRLSCEGFGFSKPEASNATEEGRALNRRVELYPIR